LGVAWHHAGCSPLVEGPFIHDDPYGYDVLQEDRMPTPDILEEEVKARAQLKK
jgi:hypothetical protein